MCNAVLSAVLSFILLHFFFFYITFVKMYIAGIA